MIVKPRSSTARFLLAWAPLILASMTGSFLAHADEKIPPIEAKTYDTQVIRRSHSMIAYLLDDPEDASPKEGKIILLRRNGEAAMAVRVLKTYPEKKEFAAIRVKSYNGYRYLDPDTKLQAVEKIADIVFVLPETAEERNSLQELEAEVPPPGLSPESTDSMPEAPPSPTPTDVPPPPGGTPPPEGALPPNSPPPENAVDQSKGELPQNGAAQGSDSQDGQDQTTPEEEADELSQIVIQDSPSYEHTRQWLTLSGGFLENGSPTGSGLAYFSGAGLRYGLNISRDFLIRRGKVQDSLTLEGSIFMYKALGASSDSYTVMPMIGALRYNLYFSEEFGIFFYGGIMHNFMAAWNLPDYKVAGPALQATLPAFGAGTFFSIGPNWDLRMDVGADFVGMGLVLRF